MIKSNYHIHTTYCDGHDSAEAMARAAYQAGLTSIGFSSHFTMIYPDDCGIEENDISSYINTIARIRENYAGAMNVLTGFELDYYMNTEDYNPLIEQIRPQLDYVIGSIHTMGYSNGIMQIIDAGPEDFAQGVSQLFETPDDFVQAYYKAVGDMAEKKKPDIIGHLDLIKKNNFGIYSEDTPLYKNAVKEVLDRIKASGCIVEVNTGGLYRYGERCLYPSVSILKEIKRRDIPIMVNGDSHTTDGIAYKYQETESLLYSLGFRNVFYWNNGAWVPQGITP